jgi:hypothetical protein
VTLPEATELLENGWPTTKQTGWVTVDVALYYNEAVGSMTLPTQMFKRACVDEKGKRINGSGVRCLTTIPYGANPTEITSAARSI